MNSPVRSGSSSSFGWLAARVSARFSLMNGLKWLVPLLVLVWSADAHAYAWMMRHGYTKCDTCHVDPSGGEALNHMGRVQSEGLLSHDWGKPTPTDDAKLLYALDEPDLFRAGGSLRGMSIYTAAKAPAPSDFKYFPMQMDAYGSADFGIVKAGLSVGAGSVRPGASFVQGAQVLRETEGTTLISRSHWLGFDISERWLLRAGRLNLPFGVRTSEHTLLVRQQTHTDRESDQQHGLALSYSSGHWRGEGMFVLGNFQMAPDDYRERGYAGYLEYSFDSKLAVGVSSLILQSARSLDFSSQERTIRHAHGPMLRYAPFDLLVLLAEVDVLKATGRGMGYAGFVTADVEVRRGLHLAGTFEAADGGKLESLGVAVPGNGQMTHGIWGGVQWFFYTHWDLRVDALLRKDAPLAILSQLHMYF